jgi:hypothetical protein
MEDNPYFQKAADRKTVCLIPNPFSSVELPGVVFGSREIRRSA